MANRFAYGNTFGTILSGGDLTTTLVISTGSIYVWGITITNNGANTGLFVEDNDGNTILSIFPNTGFTGESIEIPFLADNGLSIRTDGLGSAMRVMVAHSQAGA